MRSLVAFAALIAGTAAAVAADGAFQPPTTLPEGPFGEMIAKGEAIFTETKANAGAYVGNELSCRNCHLDRGRLANSAPMWAAFGLYPQYRAKNKSVNTFTQRIQDCFRFSMNGKKPEADSEVMVALQSYIFWLATGAPVGAKLPGQGYKLLPKPPLEPSPERGAAVFAANCALCHGADGQGTKRADGDYQFPPLWGPNSYNWGAGMHRVNTAAGFIKANMPFGRGGTLSDQEAWDVAAYVNSRPRPQDPRFTGDVAETRAKFHNDDDYYGVTLDGKVVGAEK